MRTIPQTERRNKFEKKQKIDLAMTGYDWLFMSNAERADNSKPKVDEIPLSELPEMVDENKIALTPAVEISCLSNQDQHESGEDPFRR